MTQPCTTPEQCIFTLPSLPSITEKTGNYSKIFYGITFIAIVAVTTLCISYAFGKKNYRYNSTLVRVCFPLCPIPQWLQRMAREDIFIEVVNLHTSKKSMGTFCTSGHISNQTEIFRFSDYQRHSNFVYMQMFKIPTHKLDRY